ncbi:MAG TPA: ATP-binding protein [Gemmatimonadaceae bacterium]|nr:ATP-binding protein [Gemmatimonadaceae bacterium]
MDQRGTAGETNPPPTDAAGIAGGNGDTPAPPDPDGAYAALLRQFAVQYAVSRALAASDTEEAALPRVLEALGTHLGWRFATYWTVDAPAAVLRPAVVWHAPDATLEAFAAATRGTTMPSGVGLPGRVWDTGAPCWVTDVPSDDGLPRRRVAARVGLHGAFAFPVCAEDVLLGVVEVLGPEILPPDRTLLEAVDGIGLQVGQFVARKRLVEEERRAQARNAAVLQTALDCIVTIDAEGRFLEFNPAAERTFGYRRADVLGQPMVELIVPPSLRAAHRAGMARYLATGQPRVLDHRLELAAMRADGSEFPVELTITRVPLPGPPTFTAYLRDLTEARQREARERLLLEASALLGSSLDYETTLRTLTSLVVPALADWYAVDLLESDGSLRRLVTAHRDPAKVALAEELARRYPSPSDAPVGVPHVVRTGRSELGSEITDELLAAATRDAEQLALVRALGLRSYMVVPLVLREGVGGALTFVTADSARQYTAHDLALAEELARRAGQAMENARLFREVAAAREQLQQQAVELEAQAEELEATNEELRATNDELARQTDAAARANRAKSEFLAAMSHELRTPLNAILGYVQLLADGLRGPLTETQAADLARIRRSARHLLGLITDILNFAKLESGRLQYAITAVPVDDVLAEVTELVAPQIAECELRCDCRTGDPALAVRADREKLVQILLNLLSNAVKFTPRGGEIRVSGASVGSDVALRVADTGRGIPADKLEAIFEPFVQVDPGRGARAAGTGLGLSISRELARAMGGDLRAESTAGAGATFVLTLPRAE